MATLLTMDLYFYFVCTLEKDEDCPKITHLTSWVRPGLLFSSSSVMEKEVIGKGQFGLVRRGLYKDGNAV